MTEIADNLRQLGGTIYGEAAKEVSEAARVIR